MRKKQKFIDSAIAQVDDQIVFSGKKIVTDKKHLWLKKFNTKLPLYIEIGMGAGLFLSQMIPINDQSEISANYIGIERKPDRVYKAINKNKNYLTTGNLKFIIGDADNLDLYFPKNSVAHIYLNFSDPWPKPRHEKNRLTHISFLKKYKKVLKRDGLLSIKTDNKDLFEYTLKSLKKSSFKIIHLSKDLHAENYPIKKAITEFEAKFIKEGKNINYLCAVNKKLW